MVDLIETIIFYITKYGGVFLFGYVCVAIFIEVLVKI